MKTEWPHVYFREEAWWVDTGRRIQPRKRKKFSNEDDARQQARSWRQELTQGGTTAFLTDSQRLDAVNAIKLLEEKKIKESLTECVRFLIARQYPMGGNPTLDEAIDAYLDHKNKDPDISDVYKYSLNRFERLRENLPKGIKLSEIRASQVLDHINTARSKYKGQEMWSAETKRQHFRYYRMFFDWCVAEHLMFTNPLNANGVKSPRGNEADPGILWIEDIQAMLDASWEMVEKASQHGVSSPIREEIWKWTSKWGKEDIDYRLFVYLILGIFCGMRPHEISRMTWRRFTNDYTWIRCTSEVSKTQDIRNIPIPLNCQIMLRAYISKLTGTDPEPDIDTFVLNGHFPYFKAKLRGWRKEVGVTNWPHDAMRHTFASYFLAAENDLDILMNRMGHSSPRTTLLHYVKLVDSAYWRQFWTLMPTKLKPVLDSVMPKEAKEEKDVLLNIPARRN